MTIQPQHIIAGLWKFSDTVALEQLTEVAQKWAQEDQNYHQLYVRKASKDQYAIGFSYQLDESQEPKVAHSKYFDTITDQLKRQFGNTFVGWDVASPVWVIK